ncbi:MAG TPA: hypothetical protein PK280_14665 [Planctomycetota bacterium]|nr:hypothetical protein [Planctomycetota bacterium]
MDLRSPVILAAFVALSAGCGPSVPPETVYTTSGAGSGSGSPTLSVEEARRVVAECIGRIPAHHGLDWSVGPAGNVKFRPTHLSFVQRRKVWTVGEMDAVRILAYDRPEEFRVLKDGGRFRADVRDWGVFAGHKLFKADLSWDTEAEARRFVDALEVLRRVALAEKEDRRKAGLAAEEAKRKALQDAEADFRERAAAWRALEKKPELPEEARRFRVLAEDAIRREKVPEAIAYYEKGVAECLLWAEGYFNCVVLYEKQERYDRMLWHAKRYLELDPGSQAVKNRVYIGEERLAAEMAKPRPAPPPANSEAAIYRQLEREAARLEGGSGALSGEEEKLREAKERAMKSGVR